MTDDAFDPPVSTMSAILRGMRRRCPRCGEGHLFRGILALAERCPVCELDFDLVRSDDLPAYLTVLVVGHVVVPFMIVADRNGASTAFEFGFFIPLMLVMIAALLPLFKGGAAGLNWALRVRKQPAELEEPGRVFPQD